MTDLLLVLLGGAEPSAPIRTPPETSHLPVAVQSDDVERHRGNVYSQALSIGQQEAQGGPKLPLPLQRVDEGEGEA